jgi:hypothetical protein
MTRASGGAAADGGVPGTLRLIFSYDGDEIRLLSSQRVEMAPPPSDPLEGFEGQKGFWLELRDAEGTLLHRQILHDPIRRDAEVFSEDPERSIVRIPVEHPTGAFAVLVPELPGADHIALIGSPLTETTAATAARELHRVSLAEAREREDEEQR